jgi:hypothetical protein
MCTPFIERMERRKIGTSRMSPIKARSMVMQAGEVLQGIVGREEQSP